MCVEESRVMLLIKNNDPESLFVSTRSVLIHDILDRPK